MVTLLRHYHRRLLQLRRVANACAELSTRDPPAARAPTRDLRDAGESVDDGCGVECDSEGEDEAEARPVEDESAEEEGQGEAAGDRRLDNDDMERPTVLARYLRGQSSSVEQDLTRYLPRANNKIIMSSGRGSHLSRLQQLFICV